MGAEEIQEVARGYTEAWCSQEAARVAAFYAEDGSLRINDGTAAAGRTAIAAVAQEFMTAFPDMRVEMDALLLQTDGAIYQWTLTGTNTGPGGTGKRICVSGQEIWKIDTEGSIGESQGSFDRVEYQRQLEYGCARPDAQ